LTTRATSRDATTCHTRHAGPSQPFTANRASTPSPGNADRLDCAAVDADGDAAGDNTDELGEAASEDVLDAALADAGVAVPGLQPTLTQRISASTS
jgi:hypothetical protein